MRNAIKFTSLGQVVIHTYYDFQSHQLFVSVTDTGAGIAESDLPVLFSKFGKLQRTASMNDTGIGLGLTIVKQIVERSQGSVNATSPGIG